MSRLRGLDHDRLTSLWMARLDVTRLAVESRRSKDGGWAPEACSKTKRCFNKCKLAPRRLSLAEVSFGSWAFGVMAAQFPAKVR